MKFTINTSAYEFSGSHPYCTHPSHAAKARKVRATVWVLGAIQPDGAAFWDQIEARCAKHLVECLEALDARYMAERVRALRDARSIGETVAILAHDKAQRVQHDDFCLAVAGPEQGGGCACEGLQHDDVYPCCGAHTWAEHSANVKASACSRDRLQRVLAETSR